MVHVWKVKISNVLTLSFNGSSLLRGGIDFGLRLGRAIRDYSLLRHRGGRPQASDSLDSSLDDDTDTITEHRISAFHLQILEPDTSDVLIHLDLKAGYRDPKRVQTVQFRGFNVRSTLFFDILCGLSSPVDKIRGNSRALDGRNLLNGSVAAHQAGRVMRKLSPIRTA